MTESNSHDLVDLGFLDARSKLLDIAAFLDRLERHDQADDYRVHSLQAAMNELGVSGADRARRVLTALSDPTAEPIPEAHIKGAAGAWDGGA